MSSYLVMHYYIILALGLSHHSVSDNRVIPTCPFPRISHVSGEASFREK